MLHVEILSGCRPLSSIEKLEQYFETGSVFFKEKYGEEKFVIGSNTKSDSEPPYCDFLSKSLSTDDSVLRRDTVLNKALFK
jgi:hypothetical protein